MMLYGTYSKVPTVKPLTGGGYLPDVAENYLLVDNMSDEFNGTTLDRVKWATRFHDNGGMLDHYNDELQRYDDNHVVGNGLLELTATPKPNTVGHAPSPSGIAYPEFSSQMIRSRGLARYGFYECRCKLPAGAGVWPAFWLLTDTSWCGEIDIFEFVDNIDKDHPNMIHSGNLNAIWIKGPVYTLYAEANENQQWGFWKAPAPLSPTYFTDDFHTYSLWHYPGGHTMFVDGQPTLQKQYTWKRKDTGKLGDPTGVIFNFAIGGKWPTNNWTRPVPTAPVTCFVDYIRTYQREGYSQVGLAKT